MATTHTDDPPPELESALKQIVVLRQQVEARDDRIQESKPRDRELQRLAQHPDDCATWLLDWAIKENRDSLLDALSQSSMAPSALVRPPPNKQAQKALTAEVIRKTCLRFLDLPAELRLRIYDFAAIEAFAVPCMVVYPMQSPPAPDFYDDQEEIESEQSEHQLRLRRTTACQHRLGMLRVCRQIHTEARNVYWGNVSLDMRFIYFPSSLPRLLDLIASPFKNKLQFVRHIEVETNVAEWLFFMKHGDQHHGTLVNAWKFVNATSSLSIVSLTRIRTLLFNLEAVTITRGINFFGWDYGDWAIGFTVVMDLIKTGAQVLERVYPRLNDIVTETKYGAERLRKSGPGQWELYYSREFLPQETWAEEYICDEMGVDMFVNEQGLMHSATLTNLVPR